MILGAAVAEDFVSSPLGGGRHMSRCVFNVRDDTRYPDLQGTELAGLNAAREEPVRFSFQLLNDRASGFRTAGEWSVEVCDEGGPAFFTLRFAAEELPAARNVPSPS